MLNLAAVRPLNKASSDFGTTNEEQMLKYYWLFKSL